MLRSPDLEREMGHSIGVQASRYGAEYTYFAGKNRINGVRGSRENFQPGSWHTMEMVLKPVGTDLQRFLLQYWHDGCFVGEAEVEYPQYFIGAHPYGVSFEVDSGDHRHQDFAGEIDELTAGFIAFPGLEGVQP
jgi:hypothetical protein